MTLHEVGNSKIGIVTSCEDCEKVTYYAEETLFEKLIVDTQIPKTYRSMFKRYLEWKAEQTR